MFGRVKAKLSGLRLRAKMIKYMAVIALTLGETTTIDSTQFTNMINSMLPLILGMIGIALPLIFIKYIMRFLEKILSGFG